MFIEDEYRMIFEVGGNSQGWGLPGECVPVRELKWNRFVGQRTRSSEN